MNHDYMTAHDKLSVAAEAIVKDRLPLLEDSESIGIVAAYLNYRLKEEDIGVMELSRRTGTSRQFIFNLLRGHKTLSDSFLASVSATTNISAEELAHVRAIRDLTEGKG